MKTNKIVPSLWFSADGGKIAGVLEYYKKIFGKNFEAEKINVLKDTPGGYTEFCNADFFGQTFSLMCTEQKHHELNDAFSLTINCEDQKEIDAIWDYFTKEGTVVQCGWCIDKYGLRWQVVPENLSELLARPNGWQTMMNQKKIVISEY